jgi:hypothetical protein
LEWKEMAMANERPAQKRVAIYLRVSTGEQTTENQRRELEAVAARHNWRVVEVYEDAGISPAPRDATSARASTGCSRPSPGATSTWSPHGRSIAWAGR